MFNQLLSVLKKSLGLQGYTLEPHLDSPYGISVWRKKLRKSPSQSEPKRFVVIPGFGDSPTSWLLLLSLLQRKAEFRQAGFDEICMLEFSGYMGSPATSRCFPSVEEFTQNLTKVVEQLAPHTVIGQSMGGFLSAWYATHAGDRLRNLILLCPSGFSGSPEIDADWLVTLRGILDGRPESFVKKATGPYLRNPLFALPVRGFAAELTSLLLRPDTREFMSSFDDRHWINPRLKNLRAYTTLVWGENDTLIPFVLFKEWKKLIEAAIGADRLCAVAIPGAGHGIHVDSPLAVTQLICDSLIKTAEPCTEGELSRGLR